MSGSKNHGYLHNGILCSREKGGVYTLCNGMDVTGEHYAKWNNPGGEREIPYSLTYQWNLINLNTQAKWNRRCGNKEQTDSNQRRRERMITGERRERLSKNMYKGPMDKAKVGKG